MKMLMLAVLLLFPPFIATAQEQDPLQLMLEQQHQLRLDLDEVTEGLTPRQVRIIRRAQDEFFSIAAGKQALDELTIEDKIRLENALESINAQIVNTTASLKNQEVCWRQAKTGSNTKVTRCGTKEEIDQLRSDSRAALETGSICEGTPEFTCGAMPDQPLPIRAGRPGRQ